MGRPVHATGLGADVSEAYWQVLPRDVVVPRHIAERLRQAHLLQFSELVLLKQEALHARKWDVRYRNVLRNLELTDQKLSSIADNDRREMAEIYRLMDIIAELHGEIDALTKELSDMERFCPGLAKRLAEDEDWRKALLLRDQKCAPERHIKLRPLRQAWARMPGWSREGDQDIPGVASSVYELEDARQRVNAIVGRLRQMESLQPGEKVPAVRQLSSGPSRSTSPAPSDNPVANLQRLRESEAEVRKLRLDLQASRSGERAARDETERVRQELREVRSQLRNMSPKR